MNLKRLRDPLVAALGALLIGGVSVAMANNNAAPASAPAANAEEAFNAADTDTVEVEEGDQNGPEDAAEAAEADGTGADEQDPNYAGTATIAVDESTLPEDEAAEAAALAPLATVSQADAESAALGAVSGEIVTAELGAENGFLVWSVEVRDAAGTSHDIAIDAGNGQVLGTQAGGDEE